MKLARMAKLLPLVLAILGVLSTIMAIIVAVAAPPVVPRLGWPFWMGLAVIFLLGSIAAVLNRTPYHVTFT